MSAADGGADAAADAVAAADAAAAAAEFFPTEAEESDAVAPPERYMPTASPDDPVTSAIMTVLDGKATVVGIELLDSRWNGNEVFKYTLAPADASEAAVAPLFAKLNRVEAREVFMAEAVSLTTLASTTVENLLVPRPIHVGALPRVGDFGPGAFMLLEWIDLVPFGASRPAVQESLGASLAALHASVRFADVHQGRFGFGINNFLALTPQDNTWTPSWSDFFAKRLVAQVNAAFKDKPHARAPLSNADDVDTALKPLMRTIVAGMPRFFQGVSVEPALLHGDLWIGNVGATKSEVPVMYDPASFFGHSEFDLALPRMFGGFTPKFWDAYFERLPKAAGFETRAVLYELFQNLNQLNLFGDPAVKAQIFSHAKELVLFLDGDAKK